MGAIGEISGYGRIFYNPGGLANVATQVKTSDTGGKLMEGASVAAVTYTYKSQTAFELYEIIEP